MADPSPKHIMISYNWDHKDVASRVDALLTPSWRVWRDVRSEHDQSMGSNLYASMGSAIDKAEAVVVILTPKYETSKNCHLELKLALDKGKPLYIIREAGFKPTDPTIDIAGAGKIYYSMNKDTHAFDEGTLLSRLDHELPKDSSARIIQNQKRILLVGGGKVGKSTIAAMLLNRDVVTGHNPHGINVSDALTPGTFEVCRYSNKDYMVVDTIGLTTTSGHANKAFGSKGAIENLYQFLRDSAEGYHAILFVVQCDRPTPALSVLYRAFVGEMFPDLVGRVAVVVTRDDDGVTKKYNQPYNDSNMKNHRTIRVNFRPTNSPAEDPDEPAAWRMEGAKCLSRLEGDLADWFKETPVTPKISKLERNALWELLRKILEIFGIKLSDIPQLENITSLFQSNDEAKTENRDTVD